MLQALSRTHPPKMEGKAQPTRLDMGCIRCASGASGCIVATWQATQHLGRSFQKLSCSSGQDLSSHPHRIYIEYTSTIFHVTRASLDEDQLWRRCWAVPCFFPSGHPVFGQVRSHGGDLRAMQCFERCRLEPCFRRRYGSWRVLEISSFQCSSVFNRHHQTPNFSKLLCYLLDLLADHFCQTGDFPRLRFTEQADYPDADQLFRSH